MQCVTDIESWIESKCGDDGKKYKATAGATEDSLAALSVELGAPLPYGLAELLKVHDGGLLVYDYAGLSCAEMVGCLKELKPHGKWKGDAVPFARNVDGDLFIAGAGGISRWDAESGYILDWKDTGHYILDWKVGRRVGLRARRGRDVRRVPRAVPQQDARAQARVRRWLRLD